MAIKQKDTHICVLGDGGWGTTLAIHLAKKDFNVVLWGAFPEYLHETATLRENRKFLPGFHIPEQVQFEADINRAVAGCSVVVVATPSAHLRKVLRQIRCAGLKRKSFIVLTKGIEVKSGKLMTQVIDDVLGKVPKAVVSGPNISREVAQEEPTAAVAASASPNVRRLARKLINTDFFTVLESSDVHGVQLGGALKNVMALAAGMLDGLGHGSNTKSILMARGIAEIARLGARLGSRHSTFMGLSGLGDLVTTSFSIHSRNHACGFEIGKGVPVGEILSRTEMTVEGVETCRAAFALAKKHRVPMPLTETIHAILFKRKNPAAIIDAILHKGIINEKD